MYWLGAAVGAELTHPDDIGEAEVGQARSPPALVRPSTGSAKDARGLLVHAVRATASTVRRATASRMNISSLAQGRADIGSSPAKRYAIVIGIELFYPSWPSRAPMKSPGSDKFGGVTF